MIDQVEKMMLDIVESQEFRNLLYAKILEHFGPKLSEALASHQEEDKDTVVENKDANLTPEGLGWQFRSKLSRPPNSQEGLEACTEHMLELIRHGVSPTRILEALQTRGRSGEPIWKFAERFKDDERAAARASGANASMERVLATKRMVEERSAICQATNSSMPTV